MKPTVTIWHWYVWACCCWKSCLDNATWDSRHQMTPIGIHIGAQTVTYVHCNFASGKNGRPFKSLLLCIELSTYRNAILILGKHSAKLTWVVSECKCPKLLNIYFIKPGNKVLIDFALSSSTHSYLLYNISDCLNPLLYKWNGLLLEQAMKYTIFWTCIRFVIRKRISAAQIIF